MKILCTDLPFKTLQNCKIKLLFINDTYYYLINCWYLLRPVSNFNLILLEDNKQIWSSYRFGCWGVGKNKSSFNFFSGYENTGIANNIEKGSLNLSPESSILVTSNNHILNIIIDL